MNRFVTWCVTKSVRRRAMTGVFVVGLSLTVLLLLVTRVRLVEPSKTKNSDVVFARLCDALQNELDETWPRRHADVLGPWTRSWGRAEAWRVPTQLTNEFKRQLDHQPNSAQSSQSTVMRQLAQATLATAEHRYRAALRIVRDLEPNPPAPAADMAFTGRIKSLRGDALFGLGEWEAARACYEESGGGLLLGTKVCVCLTHLVEREGRHDLANELAGALNRLGLQLNARGWTNDAIVVYKKAITLRTVSAEEDPHPELSIQLAGTLNNCGIALRNLDSFEHAIAQFDRAIGLQTQLIEDDEDGTSVRQLAETLSR